MHHDIWDYDTPTAPVLLDITVRGKRIPAVAQVTKQGFTYVFDRVSGAPVWPIVERAVPQSDVPRRSHIAHAAHTHTARSPSNARASRTPTSTT